MVRSISVTLAALSVATAAISSGPVGDRERIDRFKEGVDESPDTITPDRPSASPKPWGELETYRIPLSCPSSHLPLLTHPSQRTKWLFRVDGESEALALLRSAGVTEEEIAFLREGSETLIDDEFVRVFPEDETLLSMSTSLKSRLYGVLASFPENRYHRRPIYINTDNLSEWFRGSGLPRPILEDIARLVYPTPSGHGYFLSDVSYLMGATRNSEDERTLLRALMRRPTVVVRTRIDADTGLVPLADYWSAGAKYKDVLPLLESVTRVPDVQLLDVAHLLPPTPRKTLNTFPAPADGLDGHYPDWFWTCYNFFRFVPRDIYADSEERGEILREEYVQTSPPHHFGDLILLHSGGEIIHGCIYVAGDIVYTKDGADLFSPWVLLPLRAVVAYHDLRGDVTLSVYRRWRDS